MSNKWLPRVLARMRQLDLSEAEVNRAMSASGKGTYLTDLKRKKSASTSVENFAKLARVLRFSIGGLYEGEEPTPATLSVEGVIKGKEMWQTLARRQRREVVLSFFDGDLAVVEVGTTEMQPTYRIGDILAGTKMLGRHLDNLIGRDCILETTTGDQYIKYLARGKLPGTFSLRSFDPSEPDIVNVRLAWAAPIQMIVRGTD